MPTYKVDWLFQDTNRDRAVGWTESLYLQNGASTEAAITAGVTLARLRCRMLGSGVNWTEIRASDVDITGDSQAAPGEAPGGSIYNTQFNSDFSGQSSLAVADLPWSALLVRMTATSLYRRSYQLSGNPDACQQDNEGRITQGTWLAAFSAWRLQINVGADQWSIKSRSKDPAIPWFPLSAFSAASQLFTTFSAHGYTVGMEIRFRGRGFSPKPLGTYRIVEVPSTTTFRISPSIEATALTGLEEVRRVAYVYTRILGVVQLRYVHKKRGGLSTAVRGRARTRR